MDDLNAGTKEIISVSLEDRLGLITDISSDTVQYRVLADDGSTQLNWTNATDVVGMRVDCLIDTNNPTPWSTGHYELYIKPSIGSEAPIIGPFDFNLI